jgi:hypothetical protein
VTATACVTACVPSRCRPIRVYTVTANRLTNNRVSQRSLCATVNVHSILKYIFTIAVALRADGQWTDWTEYGACSATCGDGYKSRTRFCAAPTPKAGGAECVGADFDIQSCAAGVSCELTITTSGCEYFRMIMHLYTPTHTPQCTHHSRTYSSGRQVGRMAVVVVVHVYMRLRKSEPIARLRRQHE